MGLFLGQLGINEIYAGISNMIISQRVHVPDIAQGDDLVDQARVDGSMYGDRKLTYAIDISKTRKWLADGDTNVLKLERRPSPKCQEIVLDQFYQIGLTTDYYLSKRAWSNEGVFADFTSILLGTMRSTKYVKDFTEYNAFIGTYETDIGKQRKEWAVSDVTAGATGLEAARMEALEIARQLSDLLVDMTKRATRDYNDYRYVRKYKMSQIKIISNTAWVNKLTKFDLPTVFHEQGLLDKITENTMAPEFFGSVITEDGTTESTNTDIRALFEKEYEVPNNVDYPYAEKHEDNKWYVNCFAGDLLPNGVNYEANEVYRVDPQKAFIILVDLPEHMSGFETGTEFFNPKSLTETHYLTWGRNTYEPFYDKPYVTVYIE